MIILKYHLTQFLLIIKKNWIENTGKIFLTKNILSVYPEIKFVRKKFNIVISQIF